MNLRFKNKFIFFSILASVIISCRSGNGNNFSKDNKQSGQTFRIKEYDSLNIDASSMSLIGHWLTDGKHLIYKDNHIVPVKFYDTCGKLIKKIFSQGRGPAELSLPPLAFKVTKDNRYLYVDYSSVFYLFDTLLNSAESYNFYESFENMNEKSLNDLKNKPDPENILMYELSSNENQLEEFGNYYILPVTTEHIHYNGYYENARAKDFYKNSCTLMAVDKSNLSRKKIFAKFPKTYQNKILSNFKDCYIANNDTLLYVSYEANPEIVAYDRQLNFKCSFGRPAENIRHDFPQRNDFESAEANKIKDRSKNGYYYKIYCTNGYIFRTYRTCHNTVGIQIYKNHEFAGETELKYPLFGIIGYIPPFYYAAVKCDTEKETYTLLKFKLTVNNYEQNF